MATNREERRLQRLRGAETRNVTNIDFGSVFEGITVAETSSPRESTPQAPSENLQPSSPESQRRLPTRNASTTPRPIIVQASTSRTETVIEAPRPTNTRTIQDATVVPEPEQVEGVSEDESAARDEGLAPIEAEPIFDQTTSINPALLSHTPALTDGTGGFGNISSAPHGLFVTPGPLSPGADSETTNELDAETPSRPPGYQESRLAYRQARVRPSEPSPELSGYSEEIRESSVAEGSVDHEELDISTEGGQDDEEAAEVDDDEAAQWIGRKRPRFSMGGEAFETESVATSETAESTVSLSSYTSSPVARPIADPRRRDSPAQQRQPKRARVDRTASNGRNGDSFPISVLRLSKAPLYDRSVRDAKILNAKIPYQKHVDVNAVDVLTQICDEIVSAEVANALNMSENTNEKHERKRYRIQYKATAAFQEELKMRLMEMAISLDNSTVLAHRLEDAQESKIRLREELLAIRQERENLAVEMDQIRTKHEHDMKETEKTHMLQQTITDVELAVSRGRQQGASEAASDTRRSPNDLELDLQRISETLLGSAGTKTNESASLLQQVKAFNLFLERAAGVLETRSAGLKGKMRAT